EESANRYWAGQGVDPWTQGKMSLLHDVESTVDVGGTSPVYVSTYRYLGEDGYVVASDDTITYQGPNLGGSVRTNHLFNPRFFNRAADGSALSNTTYSNGASGGGRQISFTGSPGVSSFNIGTHPGGPAGLNQRQRTDTLPEVFSFAADFTAGGGSTAAVFVKFEIAMYEDDGSGAGAAYFTEELQVNPNETRRFTLTNLTIPEIAYEFRIICFVRRASGTNFTSGMSYTIGPAIIEEGGIVGTPFNGAS